MKQNNYNKKIKSPCVDCPQRYTCQEPCQKLKKLIPPERLKSIDLIDIQRIKKSEILSIKMFGLPKNNDERREKSLYASISPQSMPEHHRYILALYGISRSVKEIRKDVKIKFNETVTIQTVYNIINKHI